MGSRAFFVCENFELNIYKCMANRDPHVQASKGRTCGRLLGSGDDPELRMLIITHVRTKG